MTTPRTEQMDPYCLPEANAVELLAQAPWRRFAVMGDSLSAGTGDPSPGYLDLGWADRVARVLRGVHPGLSYLNTAVVGATTAQALDEQSGRVLAFHPDLLHVPCGANDLLRRQPDFSEIRRTLEHLYDHLASSTGAQLTTFTLGRAYVVPVFPDWTERVMRLNELVRTVATEHGALVVDVWDHPLNQREDLLSGDRIHFSTSGQAVLASEVVRGLAEILERAPGPRSARQHTPAH